jgi:phenazine biosynthesis protein phzE
LVRGSDPAQEVLETHAKAAGVMRAFGLVPVTGAATGAQAGPVPVAAGSGGVGDTWAADPGVCETLAARNERLAPFWLAEQGDVREPGLTGRSVLIVDNEDAFTSMLAVQLRALGLVVTRTAFESVDHERAGDFDLVVLGPGPGDPRDLSLPKVRAGRALLQRLLAPADARAGGRAQAVLGICLGHQLMCAALGFEVIRKAVPGQGDQQSVELFGRTRLVGFYNSFAALAPEGRLDAPAIELSARGDREVVGLRARLEHARLTGLQFHPESILSQDGLGILREEVSILLGV